ncbi:MAG TPA: hypothetical protein P5328_01950 [Candidatus Paceibacterota bacterium]|nr:hypothetical protein [Candidatus Paceibacterota bacterium]HRZ34484.1 hypothetical protein [Candidatus Paceibacterota bacterium]
MKTNIWWRVSYSLFIILCAFVAPWWISVVFSILGLLYFEKLYEVMVVGIVLDSLYGFNVEIFSFGFIFTLFLIIVFYLISNLRKNLLI